MLNKTANYIAKRLLNNQIIKEDSYDIYVYGLELLISFIFSTLLVIAIGAIIGRILETITFLIVFIFLRSYSGGYHAKKYYVCTIVTLCIYISTILLSLFVQTNLIMYAILGIVGLTLLIMWAPIENPNKEITQRKRKKYKFISIVLFVAFLASGIILYYFYPYISNTVFFSLCADILLMFPDKLKKGEKINVIL